MKPTDDPKEIFLTQGRVAIVDDEDYKQVSQYKWCTSKQPNGRFYAIRNISYKETNGKHKMESMHEFILGKPLPGFEIDHKNRNGLDNKRSNLRICTRSFNNANSLKRKQENRGSKYKGVKLMKDERRKKWFARLQINGKVINLGYFYKEMEAAQAYNEAAKMYFGKFARVNEIKEES